MIFIVEFLVLHFSGRKYYHLTRHASPDLRPLRPDERNSTAMRHIKVFKQGSKLQKTFYLA